MMTLTSDILWAVGYCQSFTKIWCIFFLVTSGKLESLRFITRQRDTHHCFSGFSVLEVKVEDGQDLCSILNKKSLWIALSLVWQYTIWCLLVLTGVMDPVHEPLPTFLVFATKLVLSLGLSGFGDGHHHKAMVCCTDQRIPIFDATDRGSWPHLCTLGTRLIDVLFPQCVQKVPDNNLQVQED